MVKQVYFNSSHVNKKKTHNERMHSTQKNIFSMFTFQTKSLGSFLFLFNLKGIQFCEMCQSNLVSIRGKKK